MKYTSQIIVEVPLKQFVKKLDNYSNFKHWQRGLNSLEHVSENPGEIGAKMKFKYNFKKHELVLLKTITKNKLPFEFHADYITKALYYTEHNYFEETAEGYTKWVCKNEFNPTSYKMLLKSMVIPRYFKREYMTFFNDFKNFAEKGISVNHEKT